MVFNLFLKLVKAKTEEERLKWSVIYGWSLAGIGILSFVIFASISGRIDSNEFLVSLSGWLWIISLLLFIVRYTSSKPLLGAAAAGITVITLGTIIDQLTHRRDGAFGMGALFGVIIVLFFMCLKNLIVNWFYLIRETIRYGKYIKGGTALDLTVLQPTK
ncbi:MAG: hypothetical protein ABS939_00490 [Psychrobacillus sp.]